MALQMSEIANQIVDDERERASPSAEPTRSWLSHEMNIFFEYRVDSSTVT